MPVVVLNKPSRHILVGPSYRKRSGGSINPLTSPSLGSSLGSIHTTSFLS